MIGYPKQLHNRVLFNPEAGFPLANGSVILMRVKNNYIKKKTFKTF